MEELVLSIASFLSAPESPTLTAGLLVPARRARSTPAAGAAIEIDVVREASGLAGLEAEWAELFASCSRPSSVFQSYDWNARCLASLACRAGAAARGDLFVLTGRRAGRLVALWPLARRRILGIKALTWIGDPVTPYGDILAADDVDVPAWASQAVGFIQRHAGIDTLQLAWVREDARIAPFLGAAAVAVGRQVAPWLRLDASGGESGAGRSGSRATRKSRRRRWRALEAKGQVTFRFQPGGPDAAEALAWLFALKRQWAACKAVVSRTIGSRAFEELVGSLATSPHARIESRISTLSLDGRPIAVELGFVHGTQYHSYICAYDPDFKACAPGALQFEETLRACREEGLEVVDLMPPGDRYKLSWASESTPVMSYVLPLTLRGRMHGVFARLRPTERLKRCYGLLPSLLRRLARRAFAVRVTW